jgi:methylmalonyl-CoA mutase N-terminal domain/subunit
VQPLPDRSRVDGDAVGGGGRCGLLDQPVEHIRPPHDTDARAALRRLQEAAIGDGNVFNELMRAARACSLGQITEVTVRGGQYRRNV